MTADLIFDVFYILPCGLRQILPPADTGNIALPTLHVFDDRLRLLQQNGEREGIGRLTIYQIPGADRNGFQVAQYIQLGQCNAGGALNLNAVACGRNVDGAYPARPSGLCTILKSGFPELISILSEHFAHEGPSPTQVE